MSSKMLRPTVSVSLPRQSPAALLRAEQRNASRSSFELAFAQNCVSFVSVLASCSAPCFSFVELSSVGNPFLASSSFEGECCLQDTLDCLRDAGLGCTCGGGLVSIVCLEKEDSVVFPWYCRGTCRPIHPAPLPHLHSLRRYRYLCRHLPHLELRNLSRVACPGRTLETQNRSTWRTIVRDARAHVKWNECHRAGHMLLYKPRRTARVVLHLRRKALLGHGRSFFAGPHAFSPLL